jgi:hypothetical protein
MKVLIQYYYFKAIETISDTSLISFGIEGFKLIARMWSKNEFQRSTN